MPISVTCAKCGKQLKVKDEWMGKRATCPGCQATFIVGASTTPGKTAFNPSAAAAAKAQREKAAGSFSISPGIVIAGVAALLLIGSIGMFMAGPMKVEHQWDALGDKPKDDVIDVVSRGLECYMQGLGLYNPRKARGRPEAKEVMFYRPTFVMSMPDDVEFKGTSSIGPFKGIYHPKTGEVDASIADGGGQPIPGSGGKVTAGTTVKITGREKDGKLTQEVNGKSVVLVMPPIDPDDK